MSLIKRFRTWWQPPRNAGNRLEHRQVTFLELFYDLVYVALIAELSHTLSSDLTWAGLGAFAFLFLTVWWAWLNGTTYHDLHGNNDIRTRVFTFLQMLTVVAMAVFAHTALGEGSVGFALSYAAFQLILTWLWWRTGVHDPNHRVLSRPYTISFLITTALFVGSVFVPTPTRFYLWGIAVIFSLLQPFVMVITGRINPKAQEQIDLTSPVSPSFVERFGLITIIVLGEVIVGVVGGLTGSHHLEWNTAIIGLLGGLIAIGLWWVYFDLISHHLPIQNTKNIGAWYYLHLPVTIGITTIGASLLHIIEHGGMHIASEAVWILALSISVTLLATAALSRSIQILPEHQAVHTVARRALIVSALLVVTLGFLELAIIPFLGIVVILLLSPVFFALRFWVEHFGEVEI